MTTTFAYEVNDARGNKHSGTLEAETADEASQQLRRDGYQVVDLKEDDGGDGGSLLPRRI